MAPSAALELQLHIVMHGTSTPLEGGPLRVKAPDARPSSEKAGKLLTVDADELPDLSAKVTFRWKKLSETWRPNSVTVKNFQGHPDVIQYMAYVEATKPKLQAADDKLVIRKIAKSRAVVALLRDAAFVKEKKLNRENVASLVKMDEAVIERLVGCLRARGVEAEDVPITAEDAMKLALHRIDMLEQGLAQIKRIWLLPGLKVQASLSTDA